MQTKRWLVLAGMIVGVLTVAGPAAAARAVTLEVADITIVHTIGDTFTATGQIIHEPGDGFTNPGLYLYINGLDVGGSTSIGGSASPRSYWVQYPNAHGAGPFVVKVRADIVAADLSFHQVFSPVRTKNHP